MSGAGPGTGGGKSRRMAASRRAAIGGSRRVAVYRPGEAEHTF